MKIAMLHWGFPPIIGGVETHLVSLMPELVKMGHKVSLLTGAAEGYPDKYDFKGARIVRNQYYDLNWLFKSNFQEVDDNVWDTRLLRRLFEARFRYDVIEAHSGSEALESLEKLPPDLILLDLHLPDLFGYELLTQLRSHPLTTNVPVIIISARDIEPDLRSKLTNIVDSIWSKGALDRNSLLAHVETLLLD